MLPKKRRVSKKELDLVFKQGKFISSPLLTFKFISNRNEPAKISFIAPKSVAKTAVARNFLRRRGYSVLEKYISKFPTGTTGAFIFRKSPESQAEIEEEIKNVLKKIGVKNN